MAEDDTTTSPHTIQERRWKKKPRRRPTSPCQYEGCTEWAWAQGYCDPHYQKLKSQGVIKPKRIMNDHLARFHTKYAINPVTGCWEWTGPLHPNGYGQFGVWSESRTYRAHRYSYAKLVGPIPDGLQVLHKCDVPSCVNPQHLFLGDDSDNSKDCVAKGRHASIRGTNKPKVTPAMAMNIRIMYARGLPAAYGNERNPTSMRDLASIFNVNSGTIWAILNGRSHLDP